MGTSALIRVYDGDRLLVSIYKQSDGYPTSAGQDIIDAVGARKLTNGFSGSRNGLANGMGCLAALLIAAMKGDEAGLFYIVEGQDDDWADFTYELRGYRMAPDAGVSLKVFCGSSQTIYDGPLGEYRAKDDFE